MLSCFFNTWHARFFRVSKRINNNISKLDVIPKLSLIHFDKCQYYI